MLRLLALTKLHNGWDSTGDMQQKVEKYLYISFKDGKQKEPLVSIKGRGLFILDTSLLGAFHCVFLSTSSLTLCLVFSESQEQIVGLKSQMDLIKVEEERQKLETEQKIQSAKKDLSSTVAELEARQAELIEKLKVIPHIVCVLVN